MEEFTTFLRFSKIGHIAADQVYVVYELNVLKIGKFGRTRGKVCILKNSQRPKILQFVLKNLQVPSFYQNKTKITTVF